MPGTRHELAAAAPARVTTVHGWRDLRALEPGLDALQRAAGIPVTARLAWWRAALMADRDIVPLLLAMRGLGGTLMAAALVALRDRDGECRITSVRPYTDDVWDVAAVSAGARYTVLAGLVRYAARLSCPWGFGDPCDETVTECIGMTTQREKVQVNVYSQYACKRLL